MHRHLYKDNMPRVVLQAFTTCVLYTNRSDTNRGMILRVLHENVADLLQSATSMATPQEKMARIHALMIYQSIRLFDGDLYLAHQAEKDNPLLESWLGELYNIRDNLAEEAKMDKTTLRDHPPESWEAS